MEIKFPKKLKIGCYNFKVVTNPKEGGGTFNFGDGTITIGTKYLQEDQIQFLMLYVMKF